MTHTKVKVDSRFWDGGGYLCGYLRRKVSQNGPRVDGGRGYLGTRWIRYPGSRLMCVRERVRAHTGGIEKTYPRYPEVSRTSTVRGSRCGYLGPKVSPRYPQGIPDPVIEATTTKETT